MYKPTNLSTANTSSWVAAKAREVQAFYTAEDIQWHIPSTSAPAASRLPSASVNSLAPEDQCVPVGLHSKQHGNTKRSREY